MNPATLLLSQVHPGFVQAGRVTSQAFRPTPKDDLLLSVDNGDRIRADTAWTRFTSNPACSSAGVMAIAHAECEAQALPVIEDGEPYPEKKEVERKAKLLSRQAQTRGWLFLADADS